MVVKSADLDDLEDLDICYNCKLISYYSVETGYCFIKEKTVHYTDDMCEEGEFK